MGGGDGSIPNGPQEMEESANPVRSFCFLPADVKSNPATSIDACAMRYATGQSGAPPPRRVQPTFSSSILDPKRTVNWGWGSQLRHKVATGVALSDVPLEMKETVTAELGKLVNFDAIL